MDLKNLSSKNQINLYGFDKELVNLIELYKENKLPNKIFLGGPKGVGKATLAYHLINYIFSKNEINDYDVYKLKINSLNKSYQLIQNNLHDNFHLIELRDDKNIIEISQVRQMINYSTKSSFNNMEKIILIDNVENLNLNSLNALLKIVEEKDCNDNEKKIKEWNPGIYIFKIPEVFEILNNIKANNASKEYYLTDAIGLAQQSNMNIKAIKIANSDEVLGINTAEQLEELES